MRERILCLRTRGWSRLLVGLPVLAMAAGLFAAGPQSDKAAKSRSARRVRPAEPIVARVNDQVITHRQLAQECIARRGSEVLETMISRMLVLQACDRRGVRIRAQEIDEEIGRTAARLSMTREQLLKVIKNERGIPPERYAEDIVLPGLALKKLAKPFVEVTEEDIERSFEAHYGAKVKCRWIMFDDQRTAMRIWNELRDSSKTDDGRVELEEFEHQVTRYSTDLATRSIGGQINPIGRHNTAPFQELERAAFAMKQDGEISKVIQLGDAYVVLYREGLIPSQDVKLEDARPQLEAQIYKAKMQAEVGRIFQELRKSARIENYLTGDVSLPEKSAGAADPEGKPAQRSSGARTGKKAPRKSERKVLR